MTAFCSLYLPCADNVAETLRAALIALGYELFNPFGLIPGKAYPQAVRLFVAPARGGWTRVLGAPDPALLPPLSQLAPCLFVTLDGSDAQIAAYAGGAPVSPETAFAAYIRIPDCSEPDNASPSGSAAFGVVALEALPDDVQALAGKVDLRQAQAMFGRLSSRFAQASGGDPGDLLRQPDWNSSGGLRIRALLDCLGVSGWREPDFVTLRDAYALHERRRRSPNSPLYPGDAEALAAVPDALSYTPVYAGRR